MLLPRLGTVEPAHRGAQFLDGNAFDSSSDRFVLAQVVRHPQSGIKSRTNIMISPGTQHEYGPAMSLLDVPAFGSDGAVQVVVESPRGSGLKLNYDPDRC